MKRKTVLVLYLLFSFQDKSWADQFHPLYRGPRAQAMGNAFTAVADDEQALFYNPAGLANIHRSSLNVANISAELSNNLIDGYSALDRSLWKLNIASVYHLLGKRYFLKANVNSIFVSPGFAVALLYDQQISLALKNISLPQGTLGSQTTYGSQVGFATSLMRSSRLNGDLKFGIAAKILSRAGGYRALTLTQLLSLDSNSITEKLSGFGFGFGVDAGLHYSYPFKKKFTFMSGIAMTDIGDTSFSSDADPQKGNLTVGVAGRYTSGILTTTLAYDFVHILDDADWRKKNRLGLELKFPLLSLYAGLNQIFFTYGIGLDLWLVKLMYVSYAEEQATLINQDPERRSMIQALVKLNL